jgi:uncharacterized protein (TIGR02271 family)
MVDSPSARADDVATGAADAAADIVVPLHEEAVAVTKRVVATGRVQVSRITHRREQLVDEMLAREEVTIERTPVDRPIDAVPPIREEQDTIVIPVVEEVLQIERRLILKEEVRIRRVKGTRNYQEKVTLRKQEAVVTRSPVQNAGAVQAGSGEGSASDPKEHP